MSWDKLKFNFKTIPISPQSLLIQGCECCWTSGNVRYKFCITNVQYTELSTPGASHRHDPLQPLLNPTILVLHKTWKCNYWYTTTTSVWKCRKHRKHHFIHTKRTLNTSAKAPLSSVRNISWITRTQYSTEGLNYKCNFISFIHSNWIFSFQIFTERE